MDMATCQGIFIYHIQLCLPSLVSNKQGTFELNMLNHIVEPD